MKIKKSVKKTIFLKNVVGWNRHDGCDKSNWIDCLDGLHKMYILDRYNYKTFKELIKNPEKFNASFPELSLIDNKLYIAGDGKHRITIAKCLKLSKAKVIVNCY